MAQYELDNGWETFEYDPDEDFEVLNWQDEELPRDAEGRVLEHEVYQDGAQLVEYNSTMDALARASVETQYYGTQPYDERLQQDWEAGYRAGLPLVVRNIEKNILSDKRWQHLDAESLHRLADTYEQMLNPHDRQGQPLSAREVMELQGESIGKARSLYETHVEALHYVAEVQAGYTAFNETVAEYAKSQQVIEAERDDEVDLAPEGLTEPELVADVSRSKDDEFLSPNASLDEVKRRFEAFRRSDFQERKERGRLSPEEKAQDEATTARALEELRQRLRGSQGETQAMTQVEHEDEGMEL